MATKFYNLSTDNTLGGNSPSDNIVSSQKALKTYIDNNSGGGGSSRNVGEIVPSVIPLTDAGLHLLDGALISGSGSYADFVNYIADLYLDDPTADYFEQAITGSDYTLVGNLINNNSVISGFSSSAYVKLPSAFNPGSSTWEYVLKFTTGSNLSTEQGLTSCLGSGDYCTPFYITSSGQLRAYMSTDGTSWNSNFSGEYLTLSANKTYKLKAEFTGTQYYWYLWQNNSWTVLKTVTYSTPIASGGTIIFGNNRGNSNPFYGSIDLNESYIKINGTIWWQGANMTAEESWEYKVATYGVCGTFVYDSVNNTVRLPKYGNQITTTTTSVDAYYYICIANSTKTQIEVDIDEIATDLNGKADVDFINVNNTGLSKGAGWGMPSDTVISLTLGASGSEYIAPANGWVVFTGGGNGYISLVVSGVAVFNTNQTNGGSWYSIIAPVRKGASFTVGYVNVTNRGFNFIYAVGSESEAQ